MIVLKRACIGVVSGLAFLAGCGLNPPMTVPSVDLQRYAGLWYEIAKYPVFFEQGCFGVTAEYTIRDDGKVTVLNTCREGSLDGRVRTIEGYAVSTNPPENSRLNVYFFGFPGPYWIIGLDDDYQWAVVSDPTRSTLWILSRTPQLSQETYDGILALIEAQGYDTGRLVPMPQPTE